MRCVKSYKTPNCLREYRRQAGLKQKDVAKLLGFSNTTRISLWENSACLPSLKNAFRISCLYGKLVDDVFHDLRKSLKSELSIGQ